MDNFVLMTVRTPGRELNRYIRKQADDLLACINSASPASEKNIHRMRVSLKRMLALYGFLYPQAGKKKMFIRSIRKLFKAAGRLRQVQLFIRHTDAFNLKPDMKVIYLRHLEQEKKERKKECRRELKEFRIREVERLVRHLEKGCYGNDRAAVISKADLFMAEEKQQLKKLMSGFSDPDIRHRIRKHIRSLQTVTALLEGMKPSAGLKQLSARLKTMGSLIGHWRDQTSFVSALQQFLKEKYPGRKVEVPSHMILRNRELQKQLLADIRIMLSSF